MFGGSSLFAQLTADCSGGKVRRVDVHIIVLGMLDYVGEERPVDVRRRAPMQVDRGGFEETDDDCARRSSRSLVDMAARYGAEIARVDVPANPLLSDVDRDARGPASVRVAQVAGAARIAFVGARQGGSELAATFSDRFSNCRYD